MTELRKNIILDKFVHITNMRTMVQIKLNLMKIPEK
jgi:hypothetical protein